MAVASLVLGIIAIFGWLFLIPSVLALIFGNVALTQMRRATKPQGGRGMAIAGIVLGWVSFAVFVIWLIAV